MSKQTALPSFSRQNLVVYNPNSIFVKSFSAEKKKKYKDLFGTNEFMVLDVDLIPEEKVEAMGHHQMITIEAGGEQLKLTAAMFKQYEPSQKLPHVLAFEEMCRTPRKPREEE